MTNNEIIVKDVQFYYGSKEVLSKINIHINKGEICGLIGPNGAGKTTLLKLISGFIKANNGEIIVNGCNVKDKQKKYKSKLGILIEDTVAYEKLSGYENLRIVADLYNEKISDQQIAEIVKKVDLSNVINKKYNTYSLGMKKRLGIAMALLNEPEVLILDEPTNGLDIDGIRMMRELIKYYSKEKGVTVLISSHILGELELTCDRVAFLINGQICRNEKVSDLGSSRLEEYYVHLVEEEKNK